MRIQRRLPRLAITVMVLCSAAFNSYAQQERIISAGANITELFFALGAEDDLVAVDLTSREYAAQSNLPQVGYHRQLSAEGLMSLHPTRLIGSDEMGPESTLALLKASHVEVITMPSGNSISALNKSIDRIAQITSKQHNAVQLKQQVATTIKQLQSSPLSVKPKVLFMMLSKDRPANVAGANTSIDEVIRLSGAINPAAAVIESYKPISYEGIIKMQPDYILVSDRAWDSFGGKENILAQLPLLVATPAGRKSQIIAVPSSALIGGFGLQSVQLAKELHLFFVSQ